LSYVSAADDDNYTTLERLPKPRLSLELLFTKVGNQQQLQLPHKLPTPKTLSLEAAVVVKQIHEKTTTTPTFQTSCLDPEKPQARTASTSTSDQPPSVEEVCARKKNMRVC